MNTAKKSNVNNQETRKQKHSFTHCWINALDSKDLRLETINKVPQKKQWNETKHQELSKASQLLSLHKEWGVRTGKRIGNFYLSVLDFDLDKPSIPSSYRKVLEDQLLEVAQNVKRIKTRRGYHFFCLTKNPLEGGSIYHLDLFGRKYQVADIKSLTKKSTKNMQVQGIGSQEKSEDILSKGRWCFKFSSLKKLKEYWSSFYFELKTEEIDSFLPKKKQLFLTPQRSQRKIIATVKILSWQKIADNLIRYRYSSLSSEESFEKRYFLLSYGKGWDKHAKFLEERSHQSQGVTLELKLGIKHWFLGRLFSVSD